MNISPTIQSLHTAYCRATGFSLPLTMDRERAWFDWQKAGLTPADVVLLVNHHRALAKANRPARSLRFRSLVLNVDWAEEDLAELRARARGAERHPSRAAVLAQTGRAPAVALPPPEDTAPPVRAAVNKLLADFKKSL